MLFKKTIKKIFFILHRKNLMENLTPSFLTMASEESTLF